MIGDLWIHTYLCGCKSSAYLQALIKGHVSSDYWYESCRAGYLWIRSDDGIASELSQTDLDSSGLFWCALDNKSPYYLKVIRRILT